MSDTPDTYEDRLLLLAAEALDRGLRVATDDWQRALVTAALARTRGRVADTALALDLPERTLRRVMRALRVAKEPFRSGQKRRAARATP